MSKLKHLNSTIDWASETARIIARLKATGATMAYIDLFCGAGGTSSGVEQAHYEGDKMACVILGINHDKVAIDAHRVNHPHTLHMVEDVRHVNLKPIAELIAAIRSELPYIIIVLGGSLECTHHSKAKGGDHREADSRSLAQELHRYEKAIKPDLVVIENVTEFRIWGPLMQKVKEPGNLKEYGYRRHFDELGKTLYSKNGKTWTDKNGLLFKYTRKKGMTAWMVPVPGLKGLYFREWVKKFTKAGYEYEDRTLNSAKYGAYTKRERYFGQFVSKKSGLEIQFPKPTHSKNGEHGLQKFKPVADVLDFSDTGESLFVPGRITSPKSYKRVLEGCIRFIAGGKKNYEDFLVVYNSTTKNGELKHAIRSTDRPAPTLPTRNAVYKVNVETVLPFLIQYNNNCDVRSVNESMPVLTQKEKFGLLHPAFIAQRNGGNPASKIASVENPSRTLTKTGGNQQLVQVEEILPFLAKYHGSGKNIHAVSEPSPVVDCKDRIAVNTPEPFITRDFSNGGELGSVQEPAGSVLATPKINVVSPESWLMDTNYNNVGQSTSEPSGAVLSSRRHSYLLNPQFNNNGNSIEQPAPTVIAHQDKKPLHLVQVEYGTQKFYGIAIYKSDCPEVRELKRFMAAYGIKDIKMRMLKEEELLPIQGFDKDYFERVRSKGIKVTSTNAKRFIGNSVEVRTAKSMTECYGPQLVKRINKYKKAA